MKLMQLIFLIVSNQENQLHQFNLRPVPTKE
jgi:hypothetical protein